MGRGALRALVFGVAAVSFGAFALVAVLSLVRTYEDALMEAQRPEDHVMVVVAARDLHQGVTVTQEDLYAVQVPTRYLPEGVFLSPEHVVGRIPRERILANELVRGARLANPEAGRGLNVVIPRGMRAISVEIGDGAALSGFLKPGNYVDVLLTRNVEEGETATLRTDTVLQALFVLGVNGRSGQEGEEPTRRRSSVTLMVTPQQAERLAHAENTGTLVLSLRASTDMENRELAGADRCSVSDCSTPEVFIEPTIRAYRCGTSVLEIVHGAQKDTLSVDSDGNLCVQ